MQGKLARSGVILGILVLALVMFGYGYFRWARWSALEESIARGRMLAPATTDTEALLLLLESPETPLAERNRAIWALGELGDDSVLPLLREMDRFEECDHSTRVCVRELRKAILKLEN